MLIAFYCLLFFLGAVFGSFWWVIIERGHEGFSWTDWKRVFWWRSYCPSCKNTLTRWQLIPLLGWLIQKWKCFRCKLQIPVRYLREEILMGIVFCSTGFAILWSDLTLLAQPATSRLLLIWLFLNRWLVLLFLADLFRYELNMYVRILLIIVLVCVQLIGFVGDRQMMILWWLSLAAVFGCIYGAAAWWQTKKMWVYTEWFGLGDVFMAWLIGATTALVFSAWLGIVTWIQIIFFYLTLSSALGIVFRLLRKWCTGNQDALLPFLPAMIVAFWLITFFSSAIVQFFSF